MIVVYGGTSSGKSNIAENIAVEMYKGFGEVCGEARNLVEKNLYYLATMETKSEASAQRIARHRRLRAGKGFETIEEQLDLSKVYEQVSGDVVLLECVSNLVANVMYDRYKAEPVPTSEVDNVADAIADQIFGLDAVCKLVVVTNNIFNDYYSQDAWCDGYMRVLGRVNELIVAKAEKFIEVVAGVAV